MERLIIHGVTFASFLVAFLIGVRVRVKCSIPLREINAYTLPAVFLATSLYGYIFARSLVTFVLVGDAACSGPFVVWGGNVAFLALALGLANSYLSMLKWSRR